MSYRVDIATKRNPLPTTCTPRFATEHEAMSYGRYLVRRHAFITRAQVCGDGAEVNAAFGLGTLWWTGPQPADILVEIPDHET